MGKMISLLILVFAIEMALFLFPASEDSRNNSLFSLISNPPFQSSVTSGNLDFTTGNTGNNVILIQISTLIIALITLSVVAIFGSSGFKPESIAYATFSAVFAAMTFLSIVKLWVTIYSYAGGVGSPDTGGIIASIITAPIFIVWLITSVDFIRRPD